ncbi:MAG: formylmethanofuran dehydrogenase subunit A [Alphaproteobacteria bacterium]|nr:formylmethanofuran dehydrogenase subunit A [Alphaproteobacteria bacterium]
MLTLLKGGRVVDPAHDVDAARDVFIRDGRIVAAGPGARVDVTHDVAGMVVMAGGIDLHSHIAGGKMNLARALTPEMRGVIPPAAEVGLKYAAMGYTMAVEPAMVPSNARQAHLEMADIPIIDRGAYAMLGNDDFLLALMLRRRDHRAIADYVGTMMAATRALGVKVVNPGGISAFKFNQRKLELDEQGPFYGQTPRDVLHTLARALDTLGVPHPLHVHCSNLGIPGNADTTLGTIRAVEGLPVHLTHLQFHSYGAEGDRKFSSAASHIAGAVNAAPNVSIDVGQVMFGQTVTASADTMAQYRNARFARPAKFVCMDIECDGGCGLVPFRYRSRDFVNALQWAIGLELFLLVEDPWRVALTTDHPNGGVFTSYPRLIRLLMDKGFRDDALAQIEPHARAATQLGAIKREYTLREIAILTRAGPARLLGLRDRGHLAPGAAADITVYRPAADAEAMFAAPALVFKDGQLVAREGAVLDNVRADPPRGATHIVRPDRDQAIERELRAWYDRNMLLSFDRFALSDEEFGSQDRLVLHPCRPRVM